MAAMRKSPIHKSEAIVRNKHLVSLNTEALDAFPDEHVLQLLVGPWSEGNVTETVIVYAGKEAGFETPSETGFHVHPTYDQIAYVFGGSMMVQIEGEEAFLAQPGDLVTYPAGVSHRQWVDGTDKCYALGINVPAPSA